MTDDPAARTAARAHVETATAARHVYTVVQSGTLDGESCRTPQGTWEPFRQTWESNREVRLENVGDTDVVDPWLSNGRNDYRSLDHILAAVIRPGMSDREKALALYTLQSSLRFHATSGDAEVNDPVKVYNVYGYTTCGNDSVCLAALWRAAGLRTRPARPVGHCVTQVFFDGDWHVLDGDNQVLYLRRDNRTIASEQDIVRDRDLIKRTHVQGLLGRDNRGRDEWHAAIWSWEGDDEGRRETPVPHTMSMTLRPGEAITWRWSQYRPPKCHAVQDILLWFQAASDTIRNGLWTYRPEFTAEHWRAGAESARDVRVDAGALVCDGAESGRVVWRMRSPYVFVGGRLETRIGPGEAAPRFEVSWDGEEWCMVPPDLDMDSLFPRAGKPQYEYRLRCTLPIGARLEELRVVNDIQMAPLCMPGMRVGENTFTYTDATPGARAVRITHTWVERSDATPPAPPEQAVYPPDGQTVEGTAITFRWRSPPGSVTQYQFQLADHPQMRWPLSSNFNKLVGPEPEHTLAQAGLLAPDTPYWWRVRTRGDAGAWGPWSAVWSFRASSPAPPVDVMLEFDAGSGVGTLRWKASAEGRAPRSWRVYGSDERGFSPSDTPYRRLAQHAGDFRNAALDEVAPASFVAETTDTSMVVVGVGLAPANTNRAYYRVVAVDDRGNRSGPSVQAESPRPFVYTEPPSTARVGAGLRHVVRTIRSLGQPSLRVVDAREVVHRWDEEEPRYQLREGPSWLSVESGTGLLGGTPEVPGTYRVVLEATLHREVRLLDSAMLVRGREQVIRLSRESRGPALQTFDLVVRA